MSRYLQFFCFFALALMGCTHSSETKDLNLAIWGNYLPQALQEKFEKETGVHLHISNYSSNEELLAKVQMGSSGIDVAVPSDYMVGIMIKMQLLQPLQNELLPNKQNIAERFLHPDYDPQNGFSVPYGWATAGIAVNKDLYKDPLQSWKDLFENPALQGKLALLDDVRETLGAALKMHGHSVNTVQAKELQDAQNILMQVKPRVKIFTSDSVDILKNKEVAVAQAYSSDALQAAAKTGGVVQYVLPTEGGTESVDNLVILKGAAHVKAAHQLINFLLTPEAEKAKVTAVFAGPVLKGTKALLPPELQNNKALFPADAQIQKLEPLHDLGEQNRLYEEIWTAVKTH